MSSARCPLVHCGARLVEQHDRAIGRVKLACPWCARRRAGVCRHCPRAVGGAKGKALYCPEHKRASLRAAERKHAAEHRDERNTRARVRDRNRSPEKRARKAAQRRAWRAAHPEKKAIYHRRYVLGEKRPVYLAYHRNYNAGRVERKREQMRALYYRRNPVRPDPHCAGCSEPIAWTPKPGGRAGRPPKWCDDCRPFTYTRKAA